jgi:1-deoxy-D-xylulose-5-phosphate reductoisomerase
MTKTAITILGSTGSIGRSTLAVLDLNPHLHVFALSAQRNIDLLFDQCLRYQPRYVVVTDAQAAEVMSLKLADADTDTQLLSGADALCTVASDDRVQIVMAAIVGAAGLESTLAAVRAGKRLLLANKEALVMTGELLMQAATESGAPIIPIDSEHNAIFQCLPLATAGLDAAQMRSVTKLVLTASGGPFLHRDSTDFEAITPAEACQHPKWSMGRKISVDSATLMNKGLEFIEACYLFGLQPQQIEVVVHPQSVIHSMVHFNDGSVLAQLGNPDMRIPISFGLGWPERLPSGAPPLDLVQVQKLEFEAPDTAKFPCLSLGMEAAHQKGTAPAVLNAANEEAVAAFLDGKIGFPQIPRLIAAVMAKIPCESTPSLAIIRDIDTHARNIANELITKEFCR